MKDTITNFATKQTEFLKMIKKKTMKTLQILGLFVLLAAFSPVALADNYGELKFIGFSENGKYLAYEKFETIIGNHGQYFTTYFVDTAKNSFVIAPIPFDNKEFTTTSEYRLDQLRYERRVEKNLKRFGIKRGNFGEFAVAHFLNDWSFVKPVEREGIFYEDGNSERSKK